MMKSRGIDTRLWEEYRGALYRFILTRVGDSAIADDIVQDVLVKAYEQLSTLINLEKILPWMYQITRNAIVDYYRKHRSTEDIDKVVVIEDTHTEDDIETELAQCLLPWVSQLPPNYQHAIKMSEFGDLTQKEVAQQLGLSLSGAKSRIQRGRKLLKKKLMACCRIELDRRGKVFNYECQDCSY